MVNSLAVVRELLSTRVGRGFSSILAVYGALLHMRNAGFPGVVGEDLCIVVTADSSLSELTGAPV